MSERIELTHGAPDTDSPLDYSGPDPADAIERLRSGHLWFGPVKVWCDVPALLDEFRRLLAKHHPAGWTIVSLVTPMRYREWRASLVAEEITYAWNPGPAVIDSHLAAEEQARLDRLHQRLRWKRVVRRLCDKHAFYLGGVKVIEDKRVPSGEIWFPDDLRLQED